MHRKKRSDQSRNIGKDKAFVLPGQTLDQANQQTNGHLAQHRAHPAAGVGHERDDVSGLGRCHQNTGSLRKAVRPNAACEASSNAGGGQAQFEGISTVHRVHPSLLMFALQVIPEL